MNSNIAKLLSCFYFDKTERKKIRNYLYSVDIKEVIKIPFYLYKIFIDQKKIKNAYCLFELNPFHIECMYSIYKYNKKKERNIIIFTTNKNIKRNLFNKDKYKIYIITPSVIKILDTINFFMDLDEIFVGSYFVWYPQKTIEYYFHNFLKKNKIIKCIDHDPTMHSSVINKNIKTFVLSDFLSTKFDKPYMYTFYFPKYKNQPQYIDNMSDSIKTNLKYQQEKHSKKLISVGVIGDQNRRDAETYLNILKANSSIFSYIIASDIYGSYKNKLNLQNIEYYCNAPFEKLFKCCQNATFIPFLIHGDIINNYSNRITGNINLVYGFNLIPIIDKDFATMYNLTDKEAILYSGEKELSDAIIYSQQMSDKKVDEKIKAISLKKKMYESIITNKYL